MFKNEMIFLGMQISDVFKNHVCAFECNFDVFFHVSNVLFNLSVFDSSDVYEISFFILYILYESRLPISMIMSRGWVPMRITNRIKDSKRAIDVLNNTLIHDFTSTHLKQLLVKVLVEVLSEIRNRRFDISRFADA